MMISRVLRYCCMALAMCVGSVAFAAEPVARYAVSVVGYQGKAQAEFDARQVQMVAGERTELAQAGGLLKDAHGFLQLSADEVAKGMTGSTVLLTA